MGSYVIPFRICYGSLVKDYNIFANFPKRSCYTQEGLGRLQAPDALGKTHSDGLRFRVKGLPIVRTVTTVHMGKTSMGIVEGA